MYELSDVQLRLLLKSLKITTYDHCQWNFPINSSKLFVISYNNNQSIEVTHSTEGYTALSLPKGYDFIQFKEQIIQFISNSDDNINKI